MTDTRDKRASAISTGRPFVLLAPDPDGDIAPVLDRQQIAWSYAGISAGEPVEPPVEEYDELADPRTWPERHQRWKALHARYLQKPAPAPEPGELVDVVPGADEYSGSIGELSRALELVADDVETLEAEQADMVAQLDVLKAQAELAEAIELARQLSQRRQQQLALILTIFATQ